MYDHHLSLWFVLMHLRLFALSLENFSCITAVVTLNTYGESFPQTNSFPHIQVLHIQLSFNLFFGTLQGSSVYGLYYFLCLFEAANMFVYILNYCHLKA